MLHESSKLMAESPMAFISSVQPVGSLPVARPPDAAGGYIDPMEKFPMTCHLKFQSALALLTVSMILLPSANQTLAQSHGGRSGGGGVMIVNRNDDGSGTPGMP